MSLAEIKYIDKPHPVTGLTNAKLGIWIFLTSEVMLFGAFFSTYILLRVGNPAWKTGGEYGLSMPIGLFNTIMLIGSSLTVIFAWASLKLKDFAKFRLYLLATIVMASIFLIVKILFEYMPKISHGHVPATNTFYAIYFTMTGLHALHIIGGIVVMLYFLTPMAAKMWHAEPDRFAGRIEVTGLYWHFVDLVWIFLFPVLYLL